MAVTNGKQQAADRRKAALRQADAHGLLNDGPSVLPADVGYRGPTACAAAGITYRQLDYWRRTQLVEPTVPPGGPGGQRLYGTRDILVLTVIKRLLDTGISLQQIRAAVEHLRSRSTDDLARVTLMSDGVSVYECSSPEEVADLMQSGQGLFGIALGRVCGELAEALGQLPGEALDRAGSAEPYPGDELASRRRRRLG